LNGASQVGRNWRRHCECVMGGMFVEPTWERFKWRIFLKEINLD